jgi:hypothetical protein
MLWPPGSIAAGGEPEEMFCASRAARANLARGGVCPWATGRVLADCGPARMRPAPIPCAAENAGRAQPGAGHGRVRSPPIGESRRAWPSAGILSSLIAASPALPTASALTSGLWPAGAGAADLHRGRAVWPTAAACVLACVAPSVIFCPAPSGQICIGDHSQARYPSARRHSPVRRRHSTGAFHPPLPITAPSSPKNRCKSR